MCTQKRKQYFSLDAVGRQQLRKVKSLTHVTLLREGQDKDL